MKIPSLTAVVMLVSGIVCAQQAAPLTTGNQTPVVPAPTPYAIVQSDANSRVWQRTVYEPDPSGQVMTNTHGYTELATGLNHLVNGQWVASSEQIDILPNGTATATNGQHQAYFPGDIYEGQIELVTPDGLQLFSKPLGLSYDDGTNTVMIAELTNSIGQVLGNNQVIYTNAFIGIDADLLYTYTKAGFEQDVILRQQPPTPESLGLNPDTAKIQIFTEFFSPPQPSIYTTTLPAQTGLALADQSLGFGQMEMIPGRAFLLGENAQNAGAMVSKQWIQVQGRQFLVEQVPVNAIVEGLAALPLSAMNSSSTKAARMASKHLVLPPQRLATTASKARLLSKAKTPTQGFVLDYVTINSSVTNYTFRGDTTYFISGAYWAVGTSTFEGGAVLKYTNGASLTIYGYPPVVNWLAAQYRPVIFTAMDDNSVGDAISGSTGNPTNYYANPALAAAGNDLSIGNLRVAYAQDAFDFGGAITLSITNAQIVYCQQGITSEAGNAYIENALFANVITNFSIYGSGSAFTAQNVTFSGASYVASDISYTLSGSYTFANCIFASVTNLTNSGGYFTGFSGDHNGFYSSPTFGSSQVPSSSNPFRAVGAGNFYLADGCSFFNAGTTNIDATLLASLKQRTTYPPILYSNVTVAINTTLNPQAQRDTETPGPDLGYHYDPLDYLTYGYAFTNNVQLTINSGTAIAGYNIAGIWLQDGSSIVSIGTPTSPNWFVRYQSVQEQPVLLDGNPPSEGFPVDPYHFTNAAPSATYRFTKFACPAGGGYHLYSYVAPYFYGNLLVQDCEFWSGQNQLGRGTNTVTILKNNLFARSYFSATPANSSALSYLCVTNNLFWGDSSVIFGSPTGGGSTNWSIFNNDFDSCGNIMYTNKFMSNGYNAYLNCTGYLYPTNSTDLFFTNSLVYQTGPLGTFYQPTNSPLLNMGSTNANLIGLYHYTVTTNEVVEGTNTVSIGYHYVATDTNGIPLDTNGDGVPDYVEDANGNGLVDSGEIGWNIVGDLGLKVVITRPRNGTTLP